MNIRDNTLFKTLKAYATNLPNTTEGAVNSFNVITFSGQFVRSGPEGGEFVLDTCNLVGLYSDADSRQDTTKTRASSGAEATFTDELGGIGQEPYSEPPAGE